MGPSPLYRCNMTSDNEIQAKYKRDMNELARALDDVFNGNVRPKKVAFVLLISEFGITTGRVNYISNGERSDIVTMLKEITARFEGQPEQSGTA